MVLYRYANTSHEAVVVRMKRMKNVVIKHQYCQAQPSFDGLRLAFLMLNWVLGDNYP